MTAAIRRLIAWLLGAIDRGDSACPYACPRHREAWMRRQPPRGF